MDLSLLTVIQYFRSYKTGSKKEVGDASFSGVRIGSEDKTAPVREDLCYISRLSDVTAACLLRVGAEELILYGLTLEELTNELIEMLDYYNNWEKALHQAVSRGNSLQNILELSQSILNCPAIIQDDYFNILAITNDYEDAGIDRVAHQLNTEVLSSTFRDEKLSRKLQGLTGAEEYFHPGFGSTCISAPMKLQGKRFGLITLHPAENINAKHLIQLLNQFLSAIDSGTNSVPDLLNTYPVNITWKRILLEESEYDRSIPELAAMPKWKKQGAFRLLRLIGRANETVFANYLGPRLQNLFDPCASAIIGDDLYILINEDECAAAKQKEAMKLITQSGYRCFRSMVFHSLWDIRSSVRQVRLSFFSNRAKDTQSIVQISEHAWDYIESEIIRNLKNYGLVHPLIETLNEHDRHHQTDYVGTLSVYLECERNLAKACRELHIHRNTLIYRIERIASMSDCDLDDAAVRNHLFFSIKACG